MKRLTLHSLAFVVLALFAATSQASLYSGEVAADAYVSFGGYDLAWASPCSDGLLEYSCGAIDMSEQSGYGWNIMTSDLFSSLGITASTFEVNYSSANTQYYGGKHYAKATGWFSNTWTHIDVINGLQGKWSFADVAEQSYYETIVYRAQNVAEPTTLALMSLGLAGLGFSRKLKKS